ncbi:hypothetical protein BH20ACT17_BH20ACT17_03200 [soil metagenome]
MTDGDEAAVSAEPADKCADPKTAQEGDVSTEVADTGAEMKMVHLSADHPRREPSDTAD